MRRIIVIGILLFMLVLSVFLVGAYIYINSNTSEVVGILQSFGVVPEPSKIIQSNPRGESTGQGLPDELTINFDPTVNPVVFRVESIDTKTSYFHLIGMSPSTWTGKYVVTKITCSFWDLRLTQTGETSKYVLATNLIKTIGTLEGKRVIVSGVCKDKTCTEISNACQVSIF